MTEFGQLHLVTAILMIIHRIPFRIASLSLLGPATLMATNEMETDVPTGVDGEDRSPMEEKESHGWTTQEERSTHARKRKKRRLLPGVFIDGFPEEMAPEDAYHRIAAVLPAVRVGRKNFRRLGNGGYVLRHQHAHDLFRSPLSDEVSLRPMIEEFCQGVLFAPTSIEPAAFKKLDGLVYARRWSKKGRKLRGVSLYFDSEQSLAYAVRDGLYLSQHLEVQPAHPEDLDSSQRDSWIAEESARLLSSIPERPLSKGNMNQEEAVFRTQCHEMRNRSKSHVSVKPLRPKKQRKRYKPATPAPEVSRNREDPCEEEQKVPQNNNVGSNDSSDVLSQILERLSSIESRLSSLEDQNPKPKKPFKRQDETLNLVLARLDSIESHLGSEMSCDAKESSMAPNEAPNEAFYMPQLHGHHHVEPIVIPDRRSLSRQPSRPTSPVSPFAPHMQTPGIKCASCLGSFPTVQLYESHLQQCKPQCGSCGQQFTSQQELHAHSMSCNLYCTSCQLRFRSLEEAQQHYLHYHKPLPCPFCKPSVTVYGYVNMQAHHQSHHPNIDPSSGKPIRHGAGQ